MLISFGGQYRENEEKVVNEYVYKILWRFTTFFSLFPVTR